VPGDCTPDGGDCASVTGIVVPEVAGTSAFVVVLVVVVVVVVFVVAVMVVVVMVDVVVVGCGVRALSGRGPDEQAPKVTQKPMQVTAASSLCILGEK
jgi:hypothetical protein